MSIGPFEGGVVAGAPRVSSDNSEVQGRLEKSHSSPCPVCPLQRTGWGTRTRPSSFGRGIVLLRAGLGGQVSARYVGVISVPGDTDDTPSEWVSSKAGLEGNTDLVGILAKFYGIPAIGFLEAWRRAVLRCWFVKSFAMGDTQGPLLTLTIDFSGVTTRLYEAGSHGTLGMANVH
ncbi:hypothetical protein CVT25_015094 [Psilocybe cyanescens]|uniref:Uncharacterized protein n=1 Tax=Psilocybe cyanescens TaxID=93625 RepID=A0A409WS53_PSICY|nr:hypothetical protein CVT25_015094 [Psilocybe cyanescens]